MHGKRVSHIEDPGSFKVPSAVTFGALAVGVICLLASLGMAFGAEEGPAASIAWGSVFVSFLFFWFLCMGGSSFLAIQYVTSAKWFYVMKRLPESLTAFVVPGAIIGIIIMFLGTDHIYSWAAADSDYPYAGSMKRAWLTPNLHYIKVVVYLGVLAILGTVLLKLSSKSSSEGSKLPLNRKKIGIVYLIAFGFLFSLFSWEAIMSVSPRWFSTMFGVYCFAGAFVSALSLMMMMMFSLKNKTEHLKGRHMYDLGTYVMGFSVFMIYIGFSQFMLIWYANIEDETFWYADRFAGGWILMAVAIPALKWVVPFLVLMPPPLRTNYIAQGLCFIAILAGQYIDLYWIVIPEYADTILYPGPIAILSFIGMLGIFSFTTLNYLSKNSAVPAGDKELLVSVNGDYLHA